MKKNIIIGALSLVVLVLVIGLAIPAFAADPPGTNPPVGQGVWEDMYRACQQGDWNAMNEAARQAFGDNLPLCHNWANQGGNPAVAPPSANANQVVLTGANPLAGPAPAVAQPGTGWSCH